MTATNASERFPRLLSRGKRSAEYGVDGHAINGNSRRTSHVARPDPGAPDGSYVRFDRLLEISDEFTVHSVLVLHTNRFAHLLDPRQKKLEGESLKILVSRQLDRPIATPRREVVAEP